MPKFPTSQNQVLALANRMYNGFLWHAGDFPSVNRMWLSSRRLTYKIAKKAQDQALSQVRLAAEVKAQSLDSLKRLMKNCLDKSEVDVAADPYKLALIGWGPRADRQPTEVPGPPTKLRVTAQGQGTVSFAFDRADSGGPVRNYIIERREQLDNQRFGPWILADTSYRRTAYLTNQPRGIQLEYRVAAVNTAGKSAPSNSITIVL